MPSINPTAAKKSSKPVGTQRSALREHWSWLIPLATTVATVAVFLPALRGDFVNWDDGKNFLENPHYRGLGRNELSWMFTTFHMGHYQPLSWVTLGLDYLFWGMNPFGYHLTNIVLHAANALLFYFLSTRLIAIAHPDQAQTSHVVFQSAAGLAALLFALHPLRVESVAWVTERRDVLAGFFLLSSVIFYLRASVHDYRRNLTLSVSTFILSLLSKASGMSLVAVLIILDVFPLRRLGQVSQWFDAAKRKIWLEKFWYFIPGVIAGAVALSAQQYSTAFRPFEQHDWTSRLVQAMFSALFYLYKTLVPIDLSPLYELPLNPADWYLAYFMSATMVVVLTVSLFLLRKRFPALLATWLVYLVLLAPTSGVAQSGPQLVADRYSYFSCMGWAVLAAGGVRLAQQRLAGWISPMRYGLPLVGFAVLAILAMLTWRQTWIWQDSLTLWRHALRTDPRSPFAHTNLGIALGALGRLDEAAAELAEAQRLNPRDADSYYNLGNVLAKQGRSVAAIAQFEAALRINARHADSHYELATLLARKRELVQAIKHFRTAIQLRPGDARAHYNLAQVYAAQSQWTTAVAHFRNALQYEPDHRRARLQLGKALAEIGDLSAAAAEINIVIEREPASADAHAALAHIYSSQGKKQQALQHYEEALRLMRGQERR